MSETTPRRWVVAGGGTGGHVTPALALAERIAARGDAVLLLGARQGLEARLVPEAGFELVTLPAQQLMGRSLGARLPSMLFRPELMATTAAHRASLRAKGYAVPPPHQNPPPPREPPFRS